MKPTRVIRKTNSCRLKTSPGLKFARLAAIIVMGLTWCGTLEAQETELVDRIVAVVNDDIITLYDLNRAFEPYAGNIRALKYPSEKERQTLFQVRQDILGQLIDGMLADQQVKQGQIKVSRKEIDNTIERLKESRQFTDEQLRQGLASQGMTMEEYRKEIEEQLLRSRLINREVKAKIVVTKEDIKNYYESHREQYLGDKKYHLWNLFIKVSSGSDHSERGAARNLMEANLVKLKRGQSFISLVDELKNSPSAVQGTDLGLYRLEELSKQLRQVVENMKAGEFSALLDTNFGYQIIYIEDIEETQAKPLEAVESEIEDKLYTETVDNKYQEWLEQLRARSHIKIIN